MASPEQANHGTCTAGIVRCRFKCSWRWIGSGGTRWTAGRLLAGRPELRVKLRTLLRRAGDGRDLGRCQGGKNGQRRGAGALRVGAGRIRLGMVVPGRMIVRVLVVRSPGSPRFTQYDCEPPIDRGEHESGGDERPQTEHSEYERRRPMAGAPSIP